MSLPDNPILDEVVLDRTAARPYQGLIEPGMVFAWEPDISYARVLCVVTRIDAPPPPHIIDGPGVKGYMGCGEESVVWTRPFPDGGKEVYNEFGRFREAVIPTHFKKMQVR